MPDAGAFLPKTVHIEPGSTIPGQSLAIQYDTTPTRVDFFSGGNIYVLTGK